MKERTNSWTETPRFVGRVTFQVYFGDYAERQSLENDWSDPAGVDCFYVAQKGRSYAISADTQGQIVWKGEAMDGDHIIVLTSRRVSTRYLAILKERGVSYVAAGERQIDFRVAFDVLGEEFGIRRLVVEGGGLVNGGILDCGLIDEVSLLLAPGVDGRTGPSASFDGRGGGGFSG